MSTDEQYNEDIKQETLNRWQEVALVKTRSNDSVISWLEQWGYDNEFAFKK